MKFYIPILEISTAIVLIYMIPEGIIRVISRHSKKEKGKISKFILENLRGFLFGSSVSICFLFLTGISYEELTATTVRKSSNAIRTILGQDKKSICIKRTKEKFRFTPEEFLSEATQFQPLNKTTLTDRDALLAKGNLLLILPGINFDNDKETPERIYSEALSMYCNK